MDRIVVSDEELEVEMKPIIRCLPVLLLLLSACGTPRESRPASIDGDGGRPRDSQGEAGEGEIDLAAAPTVPPDFQIYEDNVAGFSVHFPTGWTIASEDPGNLVILQSFPPEEAGSEGIPIGETKCDVVVRRDLTSVQDALARIADDETVEILAQFETTRVDGRRATVLDLGSDRVGEYGMLITEIDGQMLSITCLGSQEAFDAHSTSLQPIP